MACPVNGFASASTFVKKVILLAISSAVLIRSSILFNGFTLRKS